jgi:peptidoglycan-associated lipoprotein
MRNWFFILGFSALLAACGTSVPLSDVPVETAKTKEVLKDQAVVGSAVADINAKKIVPVDLGNKTNQDVVQASARVVYFDYDSYVIKPEFQSILSINARFAKANPDLKLALEGHTDDSGGREYNLALGQKRAEAVRESLSILGIPQRQMEAVSFGKEKPAVSGSNEAAYAKNRRVEMRYQ